MSCKQITLLLSSYVDGEVTAAESQAIRSHIHDCSACAQNVRELRIVRSIMRIEPREVEIPIGLESRLVSRVPRPERKLVLVGALAVTAIVATLLIPVMSKPAKQPLDQSRNIAMQRELARDQMSTFGADATEGASMVHYASFASK
jgi:anti-sigma factor RsiW